MHDPFGITSEKIQDAIQHWSTLPWWPIDEVPPFYGSGVYGIRDNSGLWFLKHLQDPCVYIGSSAAGSLEGSRWELTSTLHERIRTHLESLRSIAEYRKPPGLPNPQVKDFQVRIWRVKPISALAIERALVDHHKPLWNHKLKGFGWRQPLRADQKRPPFDTIYPGKKQSEKLPHSFEDEREARRRLHVYLAQKAGVFDTGPDTREMSLTWEDGNEPPPTGVFSIINEAP
jgi:hypothetical protein